MAIDLLPEFIRDHYEVHEWKHACAILHQDFPEEWADLVALLMEFRLHRSQLVAAGGSKSTISKAIDAFLYARGWSELSRPDDVRTFRPTAEAVLCRVDLLNGCA